MLAAFDATARNGSVTAAARELNLTHGAISRQVAALEFQLGASLFVRSARGVQLTNVGKAYAEEIRAALSALRNASLNGHALVDAQVSELLTGKPRYHGQFRHQAVAIRIRRRRHRYRHPLRRPELARRRMYVSDGRGSDSGLFPGAIATR
jgi:DNA-binding transcriptional LysR family regulator